MKMTEKWIEELEAQPLGAALSPSGETVTREVLLKRLHSIMVKSHLVETNGLQPMDRDLINDINRLAAEYFGDRGLFGR